MKRTIPSILLLALALVPQQVPSSHARTGEFKPPLPAERFRQMSNVDNLQHPRGYVPTAPDTFGDVEVIGEGDVPVVLLAGLGPGWRVFDRLIERTREDYLLHGVTLAGYGGSSAPPMPPKGTSFAQGTWLKGARHALGQLIDSTEMERPILVAFYSDAARVALRYALEHPDQVGGVLVLSASPWYPLPPGASRSTSMDAFADQWFKTVTNIMWPSGMWAPEVYANDRELAEKVWWDVLQPSVPTAVRYTLECWADDLVPDLVRLRTPTVVLSPGFAEGSLTGMAATTVRTRFQEPWERAVDQGAEIEHHILPETRLLIWEDDPGAVVDALENLRDRRAE